MDFESVVLAQQGANEYTDQKIAQLPKSINWKGSVNYYADLPANPSEGDAYTVRYAGSSGTTPSGVEYAWGKDKTTGTYQWVSLGSVDSVNGKTGAVVLDGSDIKVDGQVQTPVSIKDAITEQSSEISDLASALTEMTATASDVGKVAKAKTVTDGKVSEWELGEGGGGADANAVHYTADSGKSAAEKAQARTNIDVYAKADVYTKTEANNLLNAKEATANRVTSIDNNSDDQHYPTALAVYKVAGGKFMVTVESSNIEYGTVNAVSGMTTYGKSVTAVATPTSDGQFLRWIDTNTSAVLSTNASYTFTVSGNIGITAIFISNDLQLVPWATGTDREITQMIQAADAGIIELSDYWAVGDTRTVHLSATAADTARGIEAHAEQDVELVIMDATCTGFKVNGAAPHLIVGLKDGLIEVGQINTSNTNPGGWRDCKRRSWCNTEFRNSLPATVRGWFKQFSWSQGVGGGASSGLYETQDYFGLTPEKCVFGSRIYSFADEAALYDRWSWYATATNRIKKSGASVFASSWWECSPYSGSSTHFCGVSSSGSADYGYAGYSYCLAPFGCI